MRIANRLYFSLPLPIQKVSENRLNSPYLFPVFSEKTEIGISTHQVGLPRHRRAYSLRLSG